MSAKHRALFAEGNIPPGGTCLSTFVVASSGADVLVGKMAKPEVWVENFFVSPNTANKFAGSGKYVLPARHLAWYESPLDAAASILKDQVLADVPKKSIKLREVQSHLRGEPGSTENPAHWDICFVYEARLPGAKAKRLKSPEWFEELLLVPRSKLKVDDFARGHGDILEEAGLISRPRRKA